MTAGVVAVSGLPTMGATSAAAPVIDVAVSVVKDGGGNFTGSDGPGLDSSATNGVVRTNDTVQYKVDVNVIGGTATNETFTVNAPPNTEWLQLPNECTGAGSKIDGAKLICNLGSLTNKTQSVPVMLRVTGKAKNGDTIPVSATVSADNAPSKTAAAKPVTVSAAPKLDLSKKDGGFTQSVATGKDGSKGVVYQFPVTVQVKPQDDPSHPAKLGAEAVTSPISFTDDISKLLAGGASPGALLYDWGPSPRALRRRALATCRWARAARRTRSATAARSPAASRARARTSV